VTVLRRRTTLALSVGLALIGIAVLVRTALLGGGIGYALGVLFILAGVLRIYISR
jgi:hypothetical protein